MKRRKQWADKCYYGIQKWWLEFESIHSIEERTWFNLDDYLYSDK